MRCARRGEGSKKHCETLGDPTSNSIVEVCESHCWTQLESGAENVTGARVADECGGVTREVRGWQ